MVTAGDSSSRSIRQGQESRTSHEYGALVISHAQHHSFGQIRGTPRKAPPNSLTQAAPAKLLGLPTCWRGRDLCAQALLDGLLGDGHPVPFLQTGIRSPVRLKHYAQVTRVEREDVLFKPRGLPLRPTSLPPPPPPLMTSGRFFPICSHSAHTFPVTIAGLPPEAWDKESDPSPIPAVSKNPALSLTPLLQSQPPDLCPGL